MSTDAVIKIDGRELTTPGVETARITMLMWGPSGSGKTTLAATAPGVKLFILFDSDGANSLIGRQDVLVLDLSGEKHTIVTKFRADDIMFIERTLKDYPQIQTIVFDSATAFTALALENAISTGKSATLENPGVKSYGTRNAIVLRACVSLIRMTKRMGLHLIITAHEDAPSINDEGTVQFITVSLGGKIANSLGLQLSEIWHLEDTGKERRIAIRPCRQRQPMKSRMMATTSPEFIWNLDRGDGIDKWHQMWVNNKGQKIDPTK